MEVTIVAKLSQWDVQKFTNTGLQDWPDNRASRALAAIRERHGSRPGIEQSQSAHTSISMIAAMVWFNMYEPFETILHVMDNNGQYILTAVTETMDELRQLERIIAFTFKFDLSKKRSDEKALAEKREAVARAEAQEATAQAPKQKRPSVRHLRN